MNTELEDQSVKRLRLALAEALLVGKLIMELDPREGLSPDSLDLLQDFVVANILEIRNILTNVEGIEPHDNQGNATLH